MTDTPPSLVTKRRIKRFAPLQLGKMLAVLYGIMGLLFVPFFFVMSALATKLPPEQRVGMMAFGAGFALFVPVIYAAMGFVFGALGALIYNLIAKWIGGIEVEVE
jgi:glycopeptide antibiotics resistance protein